MNKQLIGCALLGIAAVLPNAASADDYYRYHHDGPAGFIADAIALPFVAAGAVLGTAAAVATAPFNDGYYLRDHGPVYAQGGYYQQPGYYAPRPTYYAPAPRVYYAPPAPAYYPAPRVVYQPYYAPGYYR